MKKTLALLLLGTSVPLCALECRPGNREFRLETATLSAVVKDGMIIELLDRKSGTLWANRSVSDTGIPAGVGIVTDLPLLRSGHMPWGEPALKQSLPPSFSRINYFVPEARSAYSLQHSGKTVEAVWKGLSNGKTFLPDAVLKMVFHEAENGALEIRTEGSSPQGNVFGVLAPVTNLDRKSRFILPSFGGMVYEDGEPGLLPFGRPPYLEAPLMILEQGRDSMALWMENPKMQPHYAFFNRSGKSFSLIFENNSLMPFEKRMSVTAPSVFLNVFPGDWKTAAAPFRDWYRTHFRKELAVRNGTEWTRRIAVVSDTSSAIPPDDQLALMKTFFPAGTLMFQVWNARAPKWDCDLPDWTPRKGYVEGVARAHDSGFKVQAYVNICCVNYQSPFWLRDRIDKFFLTRKNSIFQYKDTASDPKFNAEMFLGTVDFASGPDPFEGMKKGQLLYGDLLSPAWRKYHAEMMKVWNTLTGTDSNYEDTAGTTGDHGNGIVDGLSAGEGDVAQMRLLLETQPNVANAAEFAPAANAFGVTWPLNYPSVYGNRAFKLYRIHHQLPLSDYLFGYRQWVTSLRGFNDMTLHAMAATSDAAGGMGFVHGDYYKNKKAPDIEMDFSFAGHLHRRAVLFARKNLFPLFPEGDYPENIICMYRGNDGIYSYFDDGSLQEMRGPDGRAVYGRVNNTFRVKTELWLENWPFQNGKEISGLNPEAHYPLFPRPVQAKSSIIRTGTLPEKVFVRNYFDTPEVVYLELDTVKNGPSRVSLDMESGRKFGACYANGKKVEFGKITADLPLRLTCFTETSQKAPPETPWVIRLSEAGYPCGGPFPLITCPKATEGKETLYAPGEHSCVVFSCVAPDRNSALEVTFQDRANIFVHPHDGTVFRLYVNGIELKKYDTCHREILKWTGDREARKKMFDLRPRKWMVPLGKYAGQPVLVTIEIDPNENTNGDHPYISTPRLVRDPVQQQKEEVLE
ncbi:MAG: hypothetical protein BWY31_02008 [Lentisphaerae bacterium ADurb.Bin242]|nr:MAG: hypothetical protein BWY31_02008 [Lentisphaerae bacterium ADurb.Bin242]